jgi:hypothetical protein
MKSSLTECLNAIDYDTLNYVLEGHSEPCIDGGFTKLVCLRLSTLSLLWS